MKETRYAAIYKDLRRQIEQGILKPGDQLPTEMELTQRYMVSRITAKRALDTLAQEELATRTPGRGTFVASPSDFTPAKASMPIIGIAMNDYSSVFGKKFIYGVQSACAEQGYLTAVSNGYYTQEEETEEITRLINGGIHGLIIMPLHGASYNTTILANLLKGFPMVMADRYLPGLSVPYVGTDNRQSAKDVTRYLFARGHEVIAFISSMATTTAIQERMDGYIGAYARSNYSYNRRLMFTDVQCTMPGRDTKKSTEADVEKLCAFFTAEPKITAVIATDFWVAKLVRFSLERMGKQVPRDVSIICYDELNMPFSDFTFTHIRQEEYQIGTQAGALLLNLILHQAPVKKEVHVGYQLIPGDSVATRH